MGRLFENLAFRKLARSHETMYYYKDDKGNEVDFAILEGGNAAALYQVCFDLTDEETRAREIRSLIKAGTTLNCSNLNLITMERSEAFQLPREIQVVTAAEFL